jgi:hypothetical protein
MKRLLACAISGLVIAGACSFDWDAYDPRKSAGAGLAGGSGGSGASGGGASVGGASVGGAGAGGGCEVDADCGSGLFCGCVSIDVVGVADSSDGSGALTISTPAGVASGDVMIAAIAVRPDSATATAPSGWTLIRLDASPDDITENLYSYYRVADASEAPSHTWTFSISHNGSVGGIIAFRGADGSDPIDVHAGQNLNGPSNFGSLMVDAPSVSTSAAESMIVTLYSATSSGSWQPPTAMSESVDLASGVNISSGEALLMSYAPQAIAGATGVKTAAVKHHNEGTAVSQTIALKQLCASNSCMPQQLDGWTCSDANQCQSGNCAQNHCCDDPCSNVCDACDVPGSVGTCSPASSGALGNPDCAPYTCNGTLTTCPASCSSNVECVGGFYCDSADSCVPLKSNGQTCSSDFQCLNGECVNGYCCNSSCGGPCNACNLSGNQGTCTLRTAGATGSPSCSPYVCSGSSSACAASCSGDGDCATGFICSGGSCI